MTHIIDGKAIAAQLREDLKAQVDGMEKKPGLAVILVGDDPASHVYVKNKIKACEDVGIKSFESRLPAQESQAEIAAEIEAFNNHKITTIPSSHLTDKNNLCTYYVNNI